MDRFKKTISFVFITAMLYLTMGAPLAFAAAYAGIANFDGLTLGNLNGQAGGTGFSGNWLVYAGLPGLTVQNTVVLAGTQAITGASGAPNDKITERALSASVNSGDVYLALRSGTGSGFISFDLRDTTAGNRASQVGIRAGNIFYNVGATDQNIGTASDNTWYIFHMNILSATTWKMQYKAAGGAFNAFTGTLTYGGSISNPAGIMFEANTASAAVYADSLGNTDPDVVVIVADFGVVIFFGKW